MKRKLAAVLSTVLSVSLLASSAVYFAGATETGKEDPKTYIEITHENTTDAPINASTYWQFVADKNINFTQGDRLEYDLYVSHKLKGIGGFEMDKDHNRYQEYIRAEADYKFVGVQDGVQAAPSNAEVNAAGVWEHRVATIPQKLVGLSDGGASLNTRLIYAIDHADIPANTTVTVRLANIRITNGGETKATFFDAQNLSLMTTPVCNQDGLPGTPEVAGITTAFKTVEAPDVPDVPDVSAPENYIEIQHKNTNDADTAYTGYYQILNDTNVDFIAGDKIVYDVWVSHSLQGVGGIECELDKNFDGQNLRGTGEHPATVKVEAEKWIHREVAVTDKLIGAASDAMMQFMSAIDTATIPANTTLIVRLANIKVINGDAERYVFFGEGKTAVKDPMTAVYGGNVAGVESSIAVTVGQEAYIQIQHTNTAEADKRFATYWTLVDEDYDFVEGDYLEYDVFVSNKIKGIGGMEIEMSGNAYGENMRDCLDLFDNNGIQAHPHNFVVEEAGTWQHRKIQIPKKLIDAGLGGPAPMKLMYAVDIAEDVLPAGETVTVKLANIQLTDGNGKVKDSFFDKDHDLDLSNPGVGAGAADAAITTTFKTVGAKTPDVPDVPVIPDVPEDQQLVKIDGKKDSRYSETNSIDIVDAYGNGGVDPEENFDNVTGKLYYTWDDNYIYFYAEVKDSELKKYEPVNPYPTTPAEIQKEEDRRMTFDGMELYLDPDPTINPNDHFDANCKDTRCAEMRVAVHGADLAVFNASEKNERIYDSKYLVPFKTDDGYGFEMKWERTPGQASFRFNAAIQNSSDPHYAVAIGKAWWSSYENSIEIYFSDSPTGDGEGGEPTEPTNPVDPSTPTDPSTPSGGNDPQDPDDVDNAKTGHGLPLTAAVIAVAAAGAVWVLVRRRRVRA